MSSLFKKLTQFKILARLVTINETQDVLIHNQEEQMAQIDTLNAAIAKLAADIEALIAAQPKPLDLSAAITAVNDADAKVSAALPPLPPSA